MKYLKLFENNLIYQEISYEECAQNRETFSFNFTELKKLKELLSGYPYKDFKTSIVGNKSRVDIYFDVLTGENMVASIQKERDRWYFVYDWEGDRYYKSDSIESTIICIEKTILSY